MTKIYVAQPDDYDSNPPCGVYASIQNALSCSIAVEQYGSCADGINIYCHVIDEVIAMWDDEGHKPSLKYVDRRVAHVVCVDLTKSTLVVKINNSYCTKLNLNPNELVSNAAKGYGFEISKTTVAGEIVIFELTKGKEE